MHLIRYGTLNRLFLLKKRSSSSNLIELNCLYKAPVAFYIVLKIQKQKYFYDNYHFIFYLFSVVQLM